MRRIMPGARLYLLAALAALAALLLGKMLSPLVGTDSPYLTAWASLIFSAWYCGVGPSVVSTLISVVGVWYWFLPRFPSFVFQNARSEISGMVLFSLLSSLIIALGEANRQSKTRSEQRAAERTGIENELQEARAQLENRVQERTGELKLVNQKLSQEAARVRAQAEWLDAANDAIFVGGSDETITYWNKGAERLYGWAIAEAIGKSPHQLLQTEFPAPFAEIARQRQQGGWEGELVHTRRDGTKLTVASRWTLLKDRDNKLTGWLEINRDVTDRQAAEAARQVSAQLLKMQDDERRRIARELHDSTGQMVIALILNLGRLTASRNMSPEETQLLSESYRLLQTVNSDLRAISHLLHPLILDEVGLWTALEWYIERFIEHSGVTVALERDPTFGRLNSDLEFAIYRVVQECLTHLHRHSGSREVTVRLLQSCAEVRLKVQGRTEKPLSVLGSDVVGVGLRGMRERILHLGGNLSVESTGGGTTVEATFPIVKAAGASNDALAVA
jgi:PAS domain S-box-containing protein